jgi:short subunit dehydrogenase-like uncharacterized protein
MEPWILYGANGYTGELIARAAKERGHSPILAGRRESALVPLADELGFTYRAFALDDPRAVDDGLRGARLVLNCAGPFSKTARSMVEACLRSHTHYLDVTGEIDVFEALARRDLAAQSGGVMLLPGVGFDVVPTDCLAAHLKRRLPTADHLCLALAVDIAMSRGTILTTIEGFGRPNLVRRAGALTELPMGELHRRIDFGDGRGPRLCVSIPWGDVSSAYHSTGIGQIEVYVAASSALHLGMRASNLLAPLLRAPRVQALLKRRVARGPAGPNAAQRARGRSYVFGEVSDPHGQIARATLQAPEGYTLTIDTALGAVEHVLRNGAKPGFQTPSRAFGADFILQMQAVQRRDENQ